MAAHRYWRISVTAAVGGSTQEISEMEYRIVAGGADVTGSGTASANNNLVGAVAANAFDNNATTRWAMNNGSNWVKYDFGAGNDKDIVEIALIGAQSEPSLSPKNFTIQYSDDNAAWSTWLTVTNLTSWYAGERKIFNSSGETADTSIASSARYWRLVIQAIASSPAQVGELELHETAGGADVTGSGTAINGSGFLSGHGADKAFDNDPLNQWEYGFTDTTPHAWFAYDFGTNKNIVEIAITAYDNASRAPTSFTIQRSDDGIRWASPDITISSLSAWAAGQTRYFQSSGEVAGPSLNVRPVVCVCC